MSKWQSFNLRILLLLFVSFQLVYCSKSDDIIEDNNDPLEEVMLLEQNYTIEQLISLTSGEDIEDTVVISGYITSNGQDGNVKEGLYLEDDGYAIGIGVNYEAIQDSFAIGSEILFDCTGLEINASKRILVNVDGSPLSWEDLIKRSRKTSNTKNIKALFVSRDKEVSEDLMAQFVVISGYQFEENAVQGPFAEGNINTIRYAKNEDGFKIGVFFHAASTFAKDTIPVLRGTISGIVSSENGEMLIKPRNREDLTFTVPRNGLNYEKRSFEYGENVLPYQIMYPKDYDINQSYPLVAFLHGSGERGTNNTSQMAYGPETFGTYEARINYPAIVIFPQCPNDVMWSRRVKYKGGNGIWVFEFPVEEEPNYAMEMVIELIKQLKKDEAVDENRVYAAGLSMGGIGVFELMYYAPDLLAAGVPIAGGHDPKVAEGYANKVALWIFHGSNDTVVPPKYSRDIFAKLQELGADASYTETEGRGHEWNYVLNDPAMIEWLFQQNK